MGRFDCIYYTCVMIFFLNRRWWSSEKFCYCRIHWSSLPLQSTWWSDRGGDRWRHHGST